MFKHILITAISIYPSTLLAATPCKVTEEGIELIKNFEAFAPKAYRDSGGGWWAVGYGSNGQGINKRTVWTEAQADRRLRSDLHHLGLELCKRLRAANVVFDRDQFNALLSLAYNAGLYAATNPKLIGYMKQGKYLKASSRILLYVKVKGRIAGGLVKRRAAEQRLFLGYQWWDTKKNIYKRQGE
jgi:GH24 family phage-related lysozyme (muramidase)